jgi:hypothetical protein
MRSIVRIAVLVCLMGVPAWAVADDAPFVPTAMDPRLVVSGNGGWITGGRGAGGGSASWLGNFGPAVLGLGGEYQVVSVAHWTNGVLNGALNLGQGDWKTSLYADAHVGAGDISQRAFHYTVADGGLIAPLGPHASLQLEERRIDIDTAHGHLPKVGLTLRLTPGLSASASYAHSYGGNLDTRLKTVRLDYASKVVTWLAGYSWGPAAPAVVSGTGIQGAIVPSSGSLKEGFAGLGKSFGRFEWQLVGDWQDLKGTKRTTLTLTGTVHLSERGRPQ